jgi:PleD family two-component response regulator
LLSLAIKITGAAYWIVELHYIGFVSIVPNSKLSPQHLIEATDKALYTAKHQGRDRISAGVLASF